MGFKKIFQYITRLVHTRLSRAQFIMVIATLVGFTSGITAVLLKKLVFHLQQEVKNISISRHAFLLFPMIGLLLGLDEQ